MWNAWKGFKCNIIPDTSWLVVLKMMLQSPKVPACFFRSAFTLAKRSREYISLSLIYKAFIERSILFTWKDSFSLLYNNFNGKNDHLQNILCVFFSWHLHWKPSKDTTHGGTECSRLFSPSSSQTIADRCRQSLSSVWGRSLPKLWGRTGRLSWESQPEWTPDRLFWPSPGYQNKRTQRHINPPMGWNVLPSAFKGQILWNELVCLIKD